MIRRCRTALTLITLTAAFGPVAGSRAGSMATYQLTSTAPPGTPAVSQVVASIVPPGSVAPPSADVSPLSILPGSSGFNQSGLVDYLGAGTLANGDPLQVLRLQFDSQGFSPGGVLNFGLDLGSSYSGAPPTLMLAPGTTGLSLVPYTPPGSTTTSGDGTSTSTTSSSGSTSGTTANSAQVPEPISLALWSVAAGLGLLRARAFRRARSVSL